MSGHSKWATIKRKKGAADAARGKIFTKIGRELAIAVRDGGADLANNTRLRDIVAKAKANNMPNDTILRSIKKASGDGDGIIYESVTYEGYAPGGVAVIVESLTDNRNRTASDVRHAFDKYGGSLGANGCVGWMFERKGVLLVDIKNAPHEDEMMMMALEAGADDVSLQEDVYEITTKPADFSAVRENLESNGIAFVSAELALVPSNMQEVSDDEIAQKVMTIIEKLDDLDDVQQVYHNGILPNVEEDE